MKTINGEGKENFTATKHQSVSDYLLVQIEKGRWRAGDKLPSEEQLTVELSFSLGTIQRALRSLAEMGVVERRQGAGTFVLGTRALEKHLRHFRFKAEGDAELLPVYFKILESELTRESGPWSTFFENEGDEYVRIRRIVSINREFELFSELYLPANRFGEMVELGKSWLDGLSIRDLLNERFNAPTLNTNQSILCGTLPPRVCRTINVPNGQYGMIWTISGSSFRWIPITWQRVFIPPSDRIIEISTFKHKELPKNANTFPKN